MFKPLELTKLMLVGRRAPLDRTPLSEGMQYEDVTFKSTDGLDIRGWFIPASGDGPRRRSRSCTAGCGTASATSRGRCPSPTSVDFLPAAKALHEAGYGVLLFDLRHHGESAADKAPLTFGPCARRATSWAPSTTCAPARMSTASGSAPSAARWAATPSCTGRRSASR